MIAMGALSRLEKWYLPISMTRYSEAISRRSFEKGLDVMFNRSSQRKDFIVGAAIGSGAIALAAVEGGADFILALNAGRFRIMGAASTLSMLPVRESNSFSMSFAVDELLNRCPVPVYFGASVMTPSWSIDRILDTIEEYGFPRHYQFSHLRTLSAG
jgi:predicted TIM-barrel enzyme